LILPHVGEYIATSSNGLQWKHLLYFDEEFISVLRCEWTVNRRDSLVLGDILPPNTISMASSVRKAELFWHFFNYRVEALRFTSLDFFGLDGLVVPYNTMRTTRPADFFIFSLLRPKTPI